MKKLILGWLTSMLLLTPSLNAQHSGFMEYMNFRDTSNETSFVNGLKTVEDGLFVIGGRASFTLEFQNLFHAKLDRSGNVLSKTEENFDTLEPNIPWNKGPVELQNGNILQVAELFNFTNKDGLPFTSHLLMKFNEKGEKKEFIKIKDSSATKFLRGFCQLQDGNILLTGLAEHSIKRTDEDTFYAKESVFIQKVSPNGQTIWEKRLEELKAPDLDLLVNSAAAAPDTGFVIAGRGIVNEKDVNGGDRPETIRNDFYLKFDKNGREVWRLDLGNPEMPITAAFTLVRVQNKILKSKEGGYWFGSTWPVNITDTGGRQLFYYGRISEAGDTLWTRKRAHMDPRFISGVTNLKEKPNGNVICLGGSYVFSPKSVVFEIDQAGNLLWENHILLDEDYRHETGLIDLAFDFEDDNHLYFGGAGGTQFRNTPFSGAGFDLLVKTDSTGCLRQPCQQQVFADTFFTSASPKVSKPSAKEFTIYPNPATDQVQIKTTSQPETIESIKIINTQGKVVKTVAANKKQMKHVDVSNLKAGLYFVKLQSDASPIVKKLVVK